MWIVNTIRREEYCEISYMCKENWLLELIKVVINIGGVGYLYLYNLVTRIKNSGYLYFV